MIYRHGLVGAVQGRVDENLAVLDERSMDEEAGAGKGIQGVQVDVGDDGGDDAAEKGLVYSVPLSRSNSFRRVRNTDNRRTPLW